eukprot:77491_1
MLQFVLLGILYQSVTCQISGPCIESNVASALFPTDYFQLAHFKSKNSVYIFGGSNSEGYTNKIWKWSDTSQEPYFYVTNLTTPTDEIFMSFTQNVVVLDHYAYFVGMFEGPPYVYGNVHRFDVNTESWESEFTPMTIPLTNGCAVTNKSHIFIVGGDSGGSNPSVDVIQVYNIDSDEWSEYEFGISHGFMNSMCMMLNNNMFIFGGSYFNGGSTAPLNTIYKVQWPENTWKLVGYLATTLRCSAIVLHCDVNIILTGGDWAAYYSPTNIIQVFDISKESTNSSQSIYNATYGSKISGLIINDNMYIFGGLDESAGNATICPLDAAVCAFGNENNYTWTIIGITLGCLVLLGVTWWFVVHIRKKRRDVGKQDYKMTGMSSLIDK